MPVIEDPLALQARTGTVYPAEHADGFDRRLKRAMTERLGLTQFGVNITTLEPGARSALRHWHAQEDEFIYVLSGELTLITNAGEQLLRPSMAAGFPHGDRNGHCLVNNSGAPATYLEIGTRLKDDDVDYPDVDMKGEKRDGHYRFLHKNGEPFR